MFLLIPITLFLAVVGFTAFFVSVAGFFAVLFGGRWPGGMHRFLTGTIRLGARVGAYGYLLVDDYPRSRGPERVLRHSLALTVLAGC